MQLCHKGWSSLSSQVASVPSDKWRLLMKLTKYYDHVKFNKFIYDSIRTKLDTTLENSDRIFLSEYYGVSFKDEEWKLDNDADFFSEYLKKDTKQSNYSYGRSLVKYIEITFDNSPGYRTHSAVTVTHIDRTNIANIFNFIDSNVKGNTIAFRSNKIMPRIFIGHGGKSKQWAALKDHLHEKHNFAVEAYEIGNRAGHGIRDILESMMEKCNYAILVFNASDKDSKNRLHVRENVIHELGLFQGKLGFTKAIILFEKGTQEFSNINGIHQIRFNKGRIKETFGEVVSEINKTFS